MEDMETTPEGKKLTKYSDEWFLDKYFMYGSVEEALRSSSENLPISVAQYHRLIANSGLVKSAGRHVSLPEILHFFKQKALDPGMPIEKLYKKMPYTFKSSVATLHRVYKSIQNKAFRRLGAALLLYSEAGELLVGEETNTNNKYFKTKGDISIPMGFAKSEETDYESALRIAQHEVSTSLAISKNINFIPKNIKPILYFDLVDVRIKIYKINLDKNFDIKYCSSYKLTNHKFMNKYDLLERSDVRIGVREIVKNSLHSNEVVCETSNLNKMILNYASVR